MKQFVIISIVFLLGSVGCASPPTVPEESAGDAVACEASADRLSGADFDTTATLHLGHYVVVKKDSVYTRYRIKVIQRPTLYSRGFIVFAAEPGNHELWLYYGPVNIEEEEVID
jgi:hypothetical protein